MLNNDYFCWVIAYIDSALLKNVESDLDKYPEFEEVQAYIPTVQVLKKTFKNKEFFDDVPLLFNYGFFKVPRKFAVHRNFLDSMQKNIGCIYGWVKDPLRATTGGNIPIAEATSEEVSRLLKMAVNLGAHSAEDIGMLKKGDLITLRGYPFEGMEATFIEMDEKKKKVKVSIQIFDSHKETTVAYDNVFFTVYHNRNFDDSISVTESLDAEAMTNKVEKDIHKKYKANEQ